MHKRQLGTSDLHISPIGVGAWAMGGGNWEYGWGHQQDEESIAAIHQALDHGINWIDTAPVYGLGHSEAVVGRAIKGLVQKPYIFTKCSLVWDERGDITANLSADSLRGEVEASLRRLGVDVIDLYQIHWPNPDEDLESGWETLVDLQHEGKIRFIGVSNFNPTQMARMQAIAPVTSNQPPYSAVKPEIERDVLPYCQSTNIGVVVYSPMQAGLLTGKMTRERIRSLPENDWRKAAAEFNEPRLTRNLQIAACMEQIATKQRVPTPAVAIAWTLQNEAVTGAIVGVRRPDHVDGIVDGATCQLDDEDMTRLETLIYS